MSMKLNADERETYFSVDIETAGPNPGQYSLLSIGACTIGEPQSTFYVELQPVNDALDPAAFAIHRLDPKKLAERGLPPAEALARFETWVQDNTPVGNQPVFLAFNAPFDWMFVADYFHRYLGRNPFGHAALDVKAFYMGLSGVPWRQTTMRFVARRYLGDQELTHHALRDALDQATIFARMLAEARGDTT
jgi:DNA polymerase III epsilon subunit-like protein